MTREFFDVFFRLHYRALVKKVLFKVEGKEEDAEDVVQEAFARAWKYRESFNKEEGAFPNWFGRILSNSYKDWKTEKFNTPTMEGEESLEELFQQDNSLLKVLLNLELEKSGEDREILSLHFINGFSLIEVSKITNISIKTISRVVKNFKNKMGT